MFTTRINNSLPPSKKWLLLEQHFKPNLPEIKKTLQTLYSSVIGYYDIPLKLLSYISMHNAFYLDDLKYFANIFGLDIHQVLIINLYYELSAACTTYCTHIDNKPVMFRTMDWPMDFLKQITYKATYYNDENDYHYDVISWFGCVGLFTACNDKYAIAINYRRDSSGGNILSAIYRTLSLWWPSSYLIRDIFEKNLSTSDAYEKLKKSKLIAPVYFTFLPLEKRPRIIQRGIDSYIVKKDDISLCQTNIDIDGSGANILWSKERLEYIKKLNKTNYDTADEIFSTINRFPVINEETLYVSILSPNNNSIEARII